MTCSTTTTTTTTTTAADADAAGTDKNLLHNAHWLPDAADSGPSRYVGYYDAASLYPSSSKFFFVCVCVPSSVNQKRR